MSFKPGGQALELPVDTARSRAWCRCSARRYKETDSADGPRGDRAVHVGPPLPDLRGRRLRPEALAVKVGGRLDRRAVAPARCPSCAGWIGERCRSPSGSGRIAEKVVQEIARPRSRSSTTSASATSPSTAPRRRLSGGESQRIRLATQIGSKLMGVLYVLDEPSIGLHQRDNARLLATLQGCATWATRCWWWSTTRRPSAPPTG